MSAEAGEAEISGELSLLLDFEVSIECIKGLSKLEAKESISKLRVSGEDCLPGVLGSTLRSSPSSNSSSNKSIYCKLCSNYYY